MPRTPPFLPYGRQSLDEEDIAAVMAVLRSDWLTQGPQVEAFEAALAAHAGTAGAVACATGTAALHLALLALGIGPGDGVAVPSITFLATANAVRHAGAEVVFTDVDPDTGLMRPADLETAFATAAARGLRLRAVLPVHLAGQAAPLGELAALAATRGAVVVADACHALGTEVAENGDENRWVPVGRCGEAVMNCFSFHPVKTVAAGEGGAVTADDPGLLERLRRWRNHGMVRDATAFCDPAAGLAADGSANPWYYEMVQPGFNYRLSDLQCALGLSQLRRLGHFVERRRALMAAYDRALAPLAPWVRPLARRPGCRPGWHLCVVRIDFVAAGVERAAVMAGLHRRGIGTQVHYIPVHRQPYYRDRYGQQELSGAEHYYASTLSLPLFPAMADGDPDRVAAALAAVLNGETG